jgi:hypothetical protein
MYDEDANAYRFQQLEGRLIHTSFLEVDLRLLDNDLDDLVIDVALYSSQHGPGFLRSERVALGICFMMWQLKENRK